MAGNKLSEDSWSGPKYVPKASPMKPAPKPQPIRRIQTAVQNGGSPVDVYGKPYGNAQPINISIPLPSKAITFIKLVRRIIW